jgi:N-formylglutamate amidohydrolase
MGDAKGKPTVKLVGENGNVFNLMDICSRALKNAGQKEEAKEMCEKITHTAKSYHEALAIMMEYCNVE